MRRDFQQLALPAIPFPDGMVAVVIKSTRLAAPVADDASGIVPKGVVLQPNVFRRHRG
ncbi:MAG TPA: hypothetical protein VN957_18540 [Chthoniobacterales bacterium]|nr:hypothetical protein [Chthoniobacterales bacterium]